jgi:hypothetical protein
MPEPFKFETIYSLDSRGNVMLDVFADRFNMSDARIFREIQLGFSELEPYLAKKGIRYQDLKPALVPDAKKLERAFMFDWTACSSGWYGNEIHNLILPLLPRESSRSVLVGDWVGQHRFAEIFSASKDDPGRHVLAREDVPETVYFVYLNNLTEAAARKIESELAKCNAYVGALDLTYMSLLKACLAHMLMRVYIQHRSVIIQPHEDDFLLDEDENLIGYDFQKHGYRERSVPESLYRWFLSYKIECPVLPTHSSDTRFSLNALTPAPVALQNLVIVLEDAKHQYLLKEKEGSMERSGLLSMSTQEIATQIKSKLNSNYIYNLAWTECDPTLKFNIMLEKPGIAKYTVAMTFPLIESSGY